MAPSSMSSRPVLMFLALLALMGVYLEKREVVSLVGRHLDGYNHVWKATSLKETLEEARVEEQQGPGFPSDPTVVNNLFDQLSWNGCSAASNPGEDFLTAPFVMKEHALHSNQFYPLPSFDHFNTIQGDRKGGVALFQNAYIQGHHGTVFDCEKVYYPGGCNGGPRGKQQFNISKVLVPEEHIDTAVLIAQNWGIAYFHAMAEDLPRLAFVLDFLKAHPDAVILSNELLAKNQRVWNSWLGLSNLWIRYDPPNSYRVKKLLVPTATSCASANPHAVEKLQELFSLARLHALDNTGEKPMIVLQRRFSRGLTNHNALLAALHHRFDECCRVVEFWGAEPLQYTAALHHAASILVGPHGAGLSNAMFMRRNRAGVVEIHPAIGNSDGLDSDGNKTNHCQQRMAQAAGLETRLLVMTKHRVPFGQSYPVEDIDLVLRTVEELLATLGLQVNSTSQ